jgi:methylornithine synthase
MNLKHILSKSENEESLSRDEIIYLLQLETGEQVSRLFRTARRLRDRYFGDRIFLYGFIYTSTYCRNNCSFCFFRRSNTESNRYRKARPEILLAAKKLAESGVHLIDLTMGEDPALFNGRGAGFTRLTDLTASVCQATDLPVMVSPGVIPQDFLARLKKAGATWYACYQETHNRGLFKKLRPGQDFDLRLDAKIQAHHQGLLTEEGLLCGVGETWPDIADSIEVMKGLNTDQNRVMNFVPQQGTPMENRHPSSSRTEAKIIAVMRLVLPDRLIPASLDVDGIGGLQQRLQAGANVVTSIVPPDEGLVGVAQHSLDIEDGNRTSNAVTAVLETCGLKPATNPEYLTWIDSRHERLTLTDSGRRMACK